MPGAVVTAASVVTAVGHCVPSTSAAIRAGISRVVVYDDYFDGTGNPILAAPVRLVAPGDESEDREEHLGEITAYGLSRLLLSCGGLDRRAPVSFLIGVSDPKRPGPRYEGEDLELADRLAGCLEDMRASEIRWFPAGNVAGFAAMGAALEALERDGASQCIVGAVDSLLDETTLDWFERDGRLKSETFGRSQGLAPGEGAGFLLVESEAAARGRGRTPIARVDGLGTANESSAFTDGAGAAGHGLTRAIRGALAAVPGGAPHPGTVFADLNGEFYRAKEWSHVSLRCFQRAGPPQMLWHPAESFGDVGAAWGGVALALAAEFVRSGRATEHALCVGSDDFGGRAAVVLGPARQA